jgi:hypothetical protein
MEEWSFVRRTRQNHAIEHATVTILAQRDPRRRLFARSDPGGFLLYGAVTTPDLRAAVVEALDRLRAGEFDLAIHPNCGTNFVAAASLAGLAATVASFLSRRARWRALPLTILTSILALLAAQPLGYLAQAHITTLAEVEDVQIERIERSVWFGIPVHRVRFTYASKR